MWPFMIVTLSILIQATSVITEGVCSREETCIDTKLCPEFKRYETLTGELKKMEAKKLKSKICNRKPNKLCCKVDTDQGNTTHSDSCSGRSERYAPSFLPTIAQCGVACTGVRSVVHGEDAALGEFPWAALLRSEEITEYWDNRLKEWANRTEKLYHCGGTLINTWHVLTAAHCHTEERKVVEVILGESDTLSDPDCPMGCPKVQVKGVENVIIHDGYDSSKKGSQNDIALIRMKTEARLNLFVQLACLPLPEYNLGDSFHHPAQHQGRATVVGWGANFSNPADITQEIINQGILTTKLQKGELQILPLSECRAHHRQQDIQSSQLCAGGYAHSRTDSCRGDSGGGLFIHSGDYPGQNVGNVHVVVGVVSYGARLCGDAPAVYTKVDEAITWIKENL